MRSMTFRRLFRRLVLAATPLVLTNQCGSAGEPCDDGSRYFEFIGPAAPDGGPADLTMASSPDGGDGMDLGSDMGPGGGEADLGAAPDSNCLTLCVRAADENG